MKRRVEILPALLVSLLGGVLLPACGARKATAQASKGASETAYKTACQDVSVNDLTQRTEAFKGKKVKCTGKVLVMDRPKETGTGRTPTSLILSIADDTHAISSGQLPVYVTFEGSSDTFIYDTVTVFGEVTGSYNYQSPVIKGKVLPWVQAKFMEKLR